MAKFSVRKLGIEGIFGLSVNKPKQYFNNNEIEKARKRNRRAKYFKKNRIK